MKKEYVYVGSVSESERMDKVGRTKALLAELGWDHAITEHGRVCDWTIPPDILFKAWTLATDAEWTFEEWVEICCTNAPLEPDMWRMYFERHGVAVPDRQGSEGS